MSNRLQAPEILPPAVNGQSLGEYLATLKGAGYIVSVQLPIEGGYRYEATSLYGDPDVLVTVKPGAGFDSFEVV